MTDTRMSSPALDAQRPGVPRLVLLGGFSLLLGGQEVLLPSNAQRVLAGLGVGRRTPPGAAPPGIRRAAVV